MNRKLMNWGITLLALLGIGVAGAMRIAGREKLNDQRDEANRMEELKAAAKDSIRRSLKKNLKNFEAGTISGKSASSNSPSNNSAMENKK